MITGIRYLGCLVAIVGLVSAVVELFKAFDYVSDSTATGAELDSGFVAFYSCLAALGIALLGALLVWLARPEKLRNWGVAQSVLEWAEELPTDAPSKHLRFYGSLLVIAFVLSVITSVSHPGARAPTPVHVLFAPLIGWSMVWVVLGFHLINPVAWMFPSSLKSASRFFHFVAMLNVILAPFVWYASGLQPNEGAVVMAAAIGIAVGSSQFYRYWQTRLANRAVDSN